MSLQVRDEKCCDLGAVVCKEIIFLPHTIGKWTLQQIEEAMVYLKNTVEKVEGINNKVEGDLGVFASVFLVDDKEILQICPGSESVTGDKTNISEASLKPLPSLDAFELFRSWSSDTAEEIEKDNKTSQLGLAAEKINENPPDCVIHKDTAEELEEDDKTIKSGLATEKINLNPSDGVIRKGESDDQEGRCENYHYAQKLLFSSEYAYNLCNDMGLVKASVIVNIRKPGGKNYCDAVFSLLSDVILSKRKGDEAVEFIAAELSKLEDTRVQSDSVRQSVNFLDQIKISKIVKETETRPSLVQGDCHDGNVTKSNEEEGETKDENMGTKVGKMKSEIGLNEADKLCENSLRKESPARHGGEINDMSTNRKSEETGVDVRENTEFKPQLKQILKEEELKIVYLEKVGKMEREIGLNETGKLCDNSSRKKSPASHGGETNDMSANRESEETDIDVRENTEFKPQPKIETILNEEETETGNIQKIVLSNMLSFLMKKGTRILSEGSSYKDVHENLTVTYERLLSEDAQTHDALRLLRVKPVIDAALANAEAIVKLEATENEENVTQDEIRKLSPKSTSELPVISDQYSREEQDLTEEEQREERTSKNVTAKQIATEENNMDVKYHRKAPHVLGNKHFLNDELMADDPNMKKEESTARNEDSVKEECHVKNGDGKGELNTRDELTCGQECINVLFNVGNYDVYVKDSQHVNYEHYATEKCQKKGQHHVKDNNKTEDEYMAREECDVIDMAREEYDGIDQHDVKAEHDVKYKYDVKNEKDEQDIKDEQYTKDENDMKDGYDVKDEHDVKDDVKDEHDVKDDVKDEHEVKDEHDVKFDEHDAKDDERDMEDDEHDAKHDERDMKDNEHILKHDERDMKHERILNYTKMSNGTHVARCEHILKYVHETNDIIVKDERDVKNEQSTEDKHYVSGTEKKEEDANGTREDVMETKHEVRKTSKELKVVDKYPTMSERDMADLESLVPRRESKRGKKLIRKIFAKVKKRNNSRRNILEM